MNYKQLNEYERAIINTYLSTGKSIRFVANLLNRSPSTISREIKRNGIDKNNGIKAHGKSILRRKLSKQINLDKYKDFLNFFYDNFDKRFNGPSVIINISKKNNLFENIPSHQSLYNWINKGMLKVTKRMLLRSSNKYKRKMFKWNKPSRMHKISITLRPKEVNLRKELGHWEGDSVTMANNGSRVLTIVERVSRYSITIKSPTANMSKNYEILKNYILNSKLEFKSIKFDNGQEFNDMYKLKKSPGVRIYYCHPYSPSERGTNEVWNGLLRRFFPKGTDWRTIADEELQTATKIINKTPRKILNWKSSLEVIDI